MRQAEIGHLKGSDLIYLKPDEYVDVALTDMNGRGTSYASGNANSSILCIYVRDEESRETKTGLERIIPVSAKLLPTIEQRLSTAGEGPLFKCAWGKESITFGRT